MVQRQSLPKEIGSLTGGRPIKGHSKLANLVHVVIDGTLCMGGIIRHATISFDAAHPTLLPNDHSIFPRIVLRYHEILDHAGREHVRSALRQVSRATSIAQVCELL